MAHFMGGVEGNRGPATRLGTKDSGLHVFANGWDIGVSVDLFVDRYTGEDTALVYLTKGGNGGDSRLLGKFIPEDV